MFSKRKRKRKKDSLYLQFNIENFMNGGGLKV